jgi:hypothetical protein
VVAKLSLLVADVLLLLLLLLQIAAAKLLLPPFQIAVATKL